MKYSLKIANDFGEYFITLAFGKPRIDIQRHSETMKHSPKMLEIFGETCTSLEIFSEFFGEGWRRDDGCSASLHARKLGAWCMINGS